jgi:tetrapyrrole methylase family protein/MazG family protein
VNAPITIVGLGPGDASLVTRDAWRVLSEAEAVYLRTGQHPIVEHLPPGLSYSTFDHLYEELEDYEAVYQAIIDKVLELAAEPEGVVYAVPGDPTVGEATVLGLRKAAADAGLSIKIIHGISFIEPCLALIGVDALDGLFVADALEVATLHHPPFHPDAPALIGQIYSRMVAADVKLVLMNQYPDNHPVHLLHAAGTPEAEAEALPLHGIDHSEKIASLTALYVPPLELESAFESFQGTVSHLRAPDGCPWDAEQTHQSLRTHLMEEAYEALQAIDNQDMKALQEELGDLLLQIVIQAQIAIEEGHFSMADVVAGIQAKIIRRHPHVFGELRVADVEQVLHNWEALKAAERDQEGDGKGLLDGVPLGLPALAQAAEIQARVVRVGFDWPDLEGVLAKVEEEIQEVRKATQIEEKSLEIGDLLFALVNYARWLDIDPEAALRMANLRFRRRFQRLEERAEVEGRQLSDMTIEELDDLWESVKDEET